MDATVKSLYFGINKYIINPVIIVMFAVATLVFVYGLVEFIANKDSEDKQKEGKKHMLWGVVGLAVMAGAVGIKDVIVSLLGSIG